MRAAGGRVAGRALPAAGEAVCAAVSCRGVGGFGEEDVQFGIGHAGWPGRDAVVLQDEPVMPG